MSNLAINPAFTAEPSIVSQWGGAEAFNFVGDVVVNGVNLPLQVIEQLRQAGISAISWLTSSELQDAIYACKFDGQLIDDPGGISLRDKMTLTHAEQQARRPQRKKPRSFAEMILEERNGKPHEHEEDVGMLGM